MKLEATDFKPLRDEDYDYEAITSRRIPLGMSKMGFELSEEHELSYRIGRGMNDWRAVLCVIVNGGPYVRIASCECRTKEQAMLWCTRMHNISVANGELDKDIKATTW